MAHDLVTEALRAWRDHGWEVLDDVPAPGRTTARLAHVAVGPGGVIVLDDVAGSAPPEGRPWGVGRRRSAACRAVAATVADLAALLHPPHRTTARGALVLADHRAPAMVVEAGTVVVGRHDLAAWRASLPARLHADDVAAASGHLRGVLGGGAHRLPVQLTLQAFLAGRS